MNAIGRMTGLTLFTPVRRHRMPLLRATLWLGKHLPLAEKHILQFDFIGPNFPSPPPAEPLKAWIARNSMEGGHYYCAYPQASTRMVKGALADRQVGVQPDPMPAHGREAVRAPSRS